MNKEEEIKKVLRGLIISSSKGMTVEQLCRDYRESEGSYIPYQALGYSHILDFFNNIPDTLRIHGRGMKALVIPVASKKVEHIEEMVQRQRKPEPRRSRRRSYYRPILRPNAIRTSSPVEDDRSLIPESCDNSYTRSPINSPIEDKSTDFRSFNSNYSHSPTPSTSTNFQYNSQASSLPVANTLNQFCPIEMEEPSETSDTESQYVYKQRQRVRANLSKEAIKTYNEALSQPVSTLPVQSYTNPLKKNLRELITLHPSGIWCAELPHLYRQHFNEDLNVQAKGYCSVIHFCSSHYDVFRCVQPNKGDWKVYDVRSPPSNCETGNEPLKSSFNVHQHAELTRSPRKVHNSGALPNISLDNEFLNDEPIYQPPEEVLQYGENLNRQWLEVPEDGFVTVQVTQIYDPSKFWIQLYSEDCLIALEKLMMKIQNFYALVGDVYNIPESAIKVGLYCVALFESEWHRGIIAKIEDKYVKVFYFDYGTVGKVAVNSLKYLHKEFCSLPRQAIRARLANIRPRSPAVMWPRRASMLMLELVSNKVLVAEVMNRRNYRNYVLNVILTDTSDETTDVHINDELKKRGFAQITTEDLSEIDLYNQKGHIEKYLYFLYPSHKDIEDAIVPTADEIDIMCKNGIAIDMIFKPYIVSLELNKPYMSDVYDLVANKRTSKPNFDFTTEEILLADDEDEDETSSSSSLSTEESISEEINTLGNQVIKLKEDESTEKTEKSQSEEEPESDQVSVNEQIVDEPADTNAPENLVVKLKEMLTENKVEEVISTSNAVSLPISAKPPPGYVYSQTITTNNFVNPFQYNLNAMVTPPPVYNPFNHPNSFLQPPLGLYDNSYLSRYFAPSQMPPIPPNFYPYMNNSHYMYGSMSQPSNPIQNPSYYSGYNMMASTPTFFNSNAPPFVPRQPVASSTPNDTSKQQEQSTPLHKCPTPPKSLNDSDNSTIDLKRLAELFKVDEKQLTNILTENSNLLAALKNKSPLQTTTEQNNSKEANSQKSSKNLVNMSDEIEEKTNKNTSTKSSNKNEMAKESKKSNKDSTVIKKQIQKQNSFSSSYEAVTDSITEKSDSSVCKKSKRKSKTLKSKTKKNDSDNDLQSDKTSKTNKNKISNSTSKTKSNSESKKNVKKVVDQITVSNIESKKADKLTKNQEYEILNTKNESDKQICSSNKPKSSIENCVINKEFLGQVLTIIKINKQLYLITLQFMIQYTKFDDLNRVKQLFDSESISFPSIEFNLEKYTKIYKTLLQNNVPGCIPETKIIHLLKIEDAFILLDILFASNNKLVRELNEFATEESLRN